MNKINVFLILIIVFISYILFPTQNSTWDAYVYAAQVKWDMDLFLPHHLLYNPLLWIFHELISLFTDSVDILLAGKWMNALFQVANIFILSKILVKLKTPAKHRLLFLLIVAYSFSPWRFGTENETYIVPITFSLLGSYYYLVYTIKPHIKWIILSSLFASIACLFHQIHFLWWIGLMFGIFLYRKSFQSLLIYILPAFIVPIVYLWIISATLNQELNIDNFFNFILHDFQTGSANLNLNLKGLLMVFISFIRTFIQVHPVIYTLLIKYYIFILPLVGCIFFGIKLLYQVSNRDIIIKTSPKTLYRNIHGLIFILQLLLAIISKGNVEFMVMLPVLLIIIVSQTYNLRLSFLRNLSICLFLWNFSFGILPNAIFTYYDDDKLVDYIVKNPNQIYLFKNRMIQSKYFYVTGRDEVKTIWVSDMLNPQVVDSLVTQHDFIVTDIIDYAEIFNREKLMLDQQPNSLFNKNYSKEMIFNYGGLFGETPVYRVSKNK